MIIKKFLKKNKKKMLDTWVSPPSLFLIICYKANV